MRASFVCLLIINENGEYYRQLINKPKTEMDHKACRFIVFFKKNF